MKELIKLLRPNNWVKNLFIFLPAFFGGHLIRFRNGYLDFENLIVLIFGFISFSLMASIIYIVNDMSDIKLDKEHHVKKHRPLASGAVSIRNAIILTALLLLTIVSIQLGVKPLQDAFLPLVGYFVLFICYSFFLKKILIVDVFIIGIGFIFRILYGSEITDDKLSPWIIIMTFLLSLFLGFGKRRADLILFLNNGKNTRPSISKYNLLFLNKLVTILSSVIIFSYVMYTLSPEVMLHFGEYTYLSAIFVIYGVFRYLFIISMNSEDCNPTDLLYKDIHIQVSILLFISYFVITMYFR